ncbi:unnamed protein product [Staurois parvus]|uniref:Uncharacterized protein n=1 Tax=Staurois parvus TaxID=386267 RepID=A0ABN9H0Q7_9NEOB|nr:unnamed protein product [Staurois parvus]
MCVPVHFWCVLVCFLMHFIKFQYSSVQEKYSMFYFLFCSRNALELQAPLM